MLGAQGMQVDVLKKLPAFPIALYLNLHSCPKTQCRRYSNDFRPIYHGVLWATSNTTYMALKMSHGLQRCADWAASSPWVEND